MNLDDILDQALTDFENQNTKYGFKNEKPKLNSIINNDNNLKSNLTNSNVLNTVTNQAPSLFHPSPSSIDITGSNLNTKKVEEVGQQLMEDMINQFEELGKREDYDDSIDGVMKQLLSKDMMYEPAKMICERYPEWLALHKEELPPEKYEIYGKQYQTFQRIVAAYELEPDNYAR
jgi:peroxin-19